MYGAGAEIRLCKRYVLSGEGSVYGAVYPASVSDKGLNFRVLLQKHCIVVVVFYPSFPDRVFLLTCVFWLHAVLVP